MKRKSLWSAVILLAASTSPLAAEENYRFTLDLGYRWESGFRGSRDLYRSQLDYGEGPKLFGADFFTSSPEDANRFFDRLEFSFSDWGGEPYSSVRVRAGREGVYELRFDYRSARYFNSIPGFANPFFAAGDLSSQHRFDLAQRGADLEVRFRPGKRVSPHAFWRRTSRTGPFVTTLAADGDEFLLRADADQISNDLGGGVLLEWPRLTLSLEQGFRWFRDETVLTADGFQEGNSSRRVFGREIVLEDYQGRQDVEGFLPFSNAAAVWQPHSTVQLRGRFSYGIADWESNFTESVDGVFFSFPPAAIFYESRDLRSLGNAKRPSLWGDFTADWRPHPRLQLTERFRTRRYHVSGSTLELLTFRNVEPVLEDRVIDQVDETNLLDTLLSATVDVQEFQARFFVTPRFSIRGGHRYESKEVEVQEPFSWTRNVLILGADYDFRVGRIAAEYEYGDTDRPIFRTDPVDFHRLRVNGRWRVSERLQFSGTASVFDHDDDLASVDFTSRSRDWSLQFDYALPGRTTVHGAYERSSFRSDLSIIIPQTLQPDRSRYRERGDFGTLFVSTPIAKATTLSLGYSVWGTVGNFPLTYHQPVATLEVALTEKLTLYGKWNYYDYNEKLNLLPQDYRTHLVVFGFRVGLDRPIQ